MATFDVPLRRFTVVSSKPFDAVMESLMAPIGRPDMRGVHDAIGAAKTEADLERVVRGAVGPSELMEFIRFDAGEVLRKEHGGAGPKMIRLVVGNPLIMKEMAKAVPDAAAYAPVTILVDERASGVYLSYDLVASLLAPYGSPSASAVAADLDTKVERLLEAAAR